MAETVKIKCFVRTDREGSTCEDVVEFDRDAWRQMSDRDKDAEMRDWAFNNVEWGWWELDEEGSGEQS